MGWMVVYLPHTTHLPFLSPTPACAHIIHCYRYTLVPTILNEQEQGWRMGEHLQAVPATLTLHCREEWRSIKLTPFLHIYPTHQRASASSQAKARQEAWRGPDLASTWLFSAAAPPPPHPALAGMASCSLPPALPLPISSPVPPTATHTCLTCPAISLLSGGHVAGVGRFLYQAFLLPALCMHSVPTFKLLRDKHLSQNRMDLACALLPLHALPSHGRGTFIPCTPHLL